MKIHGKTYKVNATELDRITNRTSNNEITEKWSAGNKGYTKIFYFGG